MTKTTIITDAITYIEALKMSVEELSNQLLQMEASSFGEEKIKLKEIDDEQDTKWGIKVRPYIHTLSNLLPISFLFLFDHSKLNRWRWR